MQQTYNSFTTNMKLRIDQENQKTDEQEEIMETSKSLLYIGLYQISLFEVMNVEKGKPS